MMEAIGTAACLSDFRAAWLERELGGTPNGVAVCVQIVSGKPSWSVKLITGTVRKGTLYLTMHVTGGGKARENAEATAMRLVKEYLQLNATVERDGERRPVEEQALLGWGPPLPVRDAVLQLREWLAHAPPRQRYEHRMMRAGDVA